MRKEYITAAGPHGVPRAVSCWRPKNLFFWRGTLLCHFAGLEQGVFALSACRASWAILHSFCADAFLLVAARMVLLLGRQTVCYVGDLYPTHLSSELQLVKHQILSGFS